MSDHDAAVQAAIHHDADDEGGHGHGDDPNAGVVVGTPPTPAWIWTIALVAAVTVVGCVLLAVKIG